MDGLLKEAQHSKSAPAKPSKTLTSPEQESSLHPSGDVQPGSTIKATVTGAARPPSATCTGQTKTTGELGLAKLNHKVDQLTSLLANVVPVVQKLKASYDAAQEEEEKLFNSCEGEGEENATNKELTEPLSGPPHETALSLVDSLLASDLNEPALLEWKENIKRPENCKLLQVTKVTSEIWDITQKTT